MFLIIDVEKSIDPPSQLKVDVPRSVDKDGMVATAHPAKISITNGDIFNIVKAVEIVKLKHTLQYD